MMTEDKRKQILDMLDTLQEHLLSLPDDMLLNIDPRDNESLRMGTEFIQQFNENLDEFTGSAGKIKAQIKSHFNLNPEEEDVERELSDRQERQRIIRELDKTAPHSIEENFTYKRPYGFILQDAAYKGIKTWKNLYINLLGYLKDQDPDKFHNLPANDKFISNRGNPLFSTDPDRLRVPAEFEPRFHVEVNLSANNIRNNIKALLEEFGISASELKIYLREDRDAGM
jgi:hypothetical protein